MTNRRNATLQRIAILVGIVFLLAGCTSIRLIGDYDEQIDRSATDLQKRMDKYLTEIEAAPDAPDSAFEANKQFYIDYEVDVRSVQVRAENQCAYQKLRPPCVRCG